MGEMQEVTSRVGASECFQGRVSKEMAMECAEGRYSSTWIACIKVGNAGSII